MASTPVLFLLLFGVFCCNFLPIQADCEEENAQGPIVSSMYVWSSTHLSNGVIVENPLHVNWGPPSGVNVTKYEIQYSQKSIPQLDFRLQTVGRRRTIKLAQVTKSFDYDFRVRVFANGRFGPWSKKKTYLAETGRLGPPRGIRVTRGSSQTKYLVSFTAPPQRGAWRPITIVSYRIFYYDAPHAALIAWNQAEVSAPRGPTAPPAEITVEDPTKVYVFRVQAREKDGRYGNVSGVITTDDFATATPGKPRNFRAVETTSSSISLAWDHPNNWQVGRLTSYLLEFQAASGRGTQHTIFLQSDTTEYLADDELRANTAYRFTLTAKFLGEPVPEGPAIITVQTKA